MAADIPDPGADPSLSLFTDAARSAWMRLRTMIVLRWLAVSGQTAAVLLAHFGLGLRLPLGLCAIVIGASVVSNLTAALITPRNRRLSEAEAALVLAFDLCQLGALLFLTGGLGNPFALLMMAPVTISASVLTLRATVLLALVAMAIITGLVLLHMPLRLASGLDLAPPPILMVGTWASLVIGILFQAIYARQVTTETFSMSQALSATQMALGREQRITALGGVIAAAAHELGTPLATIKLVSTELAEELAAGPAQCSDLREDALLIRDQADRCRDILRSMGPRGKDDTHVHYAPISSVVEEAAAPHAARGIRIITRVEGAPVEEGSGTQPELARRPEIIQGLRNLIQNAVDFARTTVWIDIDWTQSKLRVVIGDDGPGYPNELLGRIGDPFIRRRGGSPRERPGYEGMGLGLFISKTLLARTGAELSFGNGSENPREARLAGPAEFSRATGAVAAVVWPRARVSRGAQAPRAPLGRNAQVGG